VTLTKVKRKGKETKLKLAGEVRECVDSYKNLFAFSFDNIRNNKLAAIRTQFKSDGRFFLGKNKVMALALGRIAQEEYKENLHRVSKFLTGQCGLLFTNQPVDDVVRFFKTMKETDFARSGNVASDAVELDAGPMEQFPFSIEPQLRKLGLPTKLEKGVVALTTDHVVCQAGDKLTPEQAKILKFLGIKMAEFKIRLLCAWSKGEDDSTPVFKKLAAKKSQEKKRKSKKSKDDAIMETE